MFTCFVLYLVSSSLNSIEYDDKFLLLHIKFINYVKKTKIFRTPNNKIFKFKLTSVRYFI